jgi:hypothetical protein
MRGSRGGEVTHPLQWARSTITRADPRARLAERVAAELKEQLPDDHLVLARHASRDGGERIPVVVIGRHRLLVIEPREDEGDLVCYQDHWYRHIDGAMAQTIGDPPSLRAKLNAQRLRRDLGTGGFINVPIEPLVLLTRARPLDVRSSCVEVIAGVDPLARHIRELAEGAADPEHVRALAAALDHPINLATA